MFNPLQHTTNLQLTTLSIINFTCCHIVFKSRLLQVLKMHLQVEKDLFLCFLDRSNNMVGIRIRHLPEQSLEKTLKIYFSKPEHGGGKIQKIYHHPLMNNDAVIIFEDQKGTFSISWRNCDVNSTVSHLSTHFDTSAADDFLKHGDKRRNCSSWAIFPYLTMFSTSFSN